MYATRIGNTVHYSVEVGDLVYVDSLTAGLVPGKLLAVDANGRGLVQYTVSRGAFKRGEVQYHPPTWIVSRQTVRFRKYETKILGPTYVVS